MFVIMCWAVCDPATTCALGVKCVSDVFCVVVVWPEVLKDLCGRLARCKINHVGSSLIIAVSNNTARNFQTPVVTGVCLLIFQVLRLHS